MEENKNVRYREKPAMLPLIRDTGPATAPILPHREMAAYEALWLRKGSSFKTIADMFRDRPGALPSDFVPPEEAGSAYAEAVRILKRRGVEHYGTRVHGAGDYPERIRDAKEPVELLYYQGAWEYADTPSVAIVGTRNPSDDGVLRARRLARILVERDITVVSGLASGIDTAAHMAAIEAKGRTIAVIGTPIGTVYPRENSRLQAYIAAHHLLVSQVPIVRYERQAPQQNRFFFPERNKTMSALTVATIIVEAGETSGTLTQARAAIHQGRKLLILDSLFNRPDLTWPHRFLERGAVRVRDADDVLAHVV